MKRIPLSGLLLLAVLPQLAQDNAGDSGNPGTTAWMLISTTLVLFMGPGPDMYIGSLERTLNAVGTIKYGFTYRTIEDRNPTEMNISGLDQSLHGEHGYGLIHSD